MVSDHGGSVNLPSVGLGRRGEIALAKTSVVRDHRADGAPGLITVLGVRYTTARHTAEQAVNLVADTLGRRLAPNRSSVAPLVGGEIGDLDAFLATTRLAPAAVSSAALERLARSYGTRYQRVLSLAEADAGLAASIGAACDVTGAEVLHSVCEEMAVRLSDVVFRRTEAGSAAFPGRDALDRSAAIMDAECGWDRSRTAAETVVVEAHYRILE